MRAKFIKAPQTLKTLLQKEAVDVSLHVQNNAITSKVPQGSVLYSTFIVFYSNDTDNVA